jgi:class 3 adenylate cyclase
MEPRIQYAKTSDGVSIAYGEAGEGRPIISMPGPGFGHAEFTWTFFGHVSQPLASTFHSVWFDVRGTGLSDRDAIDFSLEAMTRDLDAVVARTGFDTFVLVGWTSAAAPALAYAAAHPERVSHLILTDGSADFSHTARTAAYRAVTALLEMDWMLFTETFGQVLWGYANPEFGRAYGQYMRACSEPEAHRALWRAYETYDVTALLPRVSAPTLVIHNKNNRLIPVSAGQQLAAAIPGARLALIDDITYAATPELIAAFALEGESASPGPELPSGMLAILFADIVDSTALTERLGDAAFRAKARDLDTAMRGIISDYSGTAIEGKLLGDGVLAVFTSARQAIEAALACAKAGDGAGLPLHLGLHAGDVIREDNNVYGGAVNIASRISGISAPGEVLVSDIVRGLARTSAGVRFEDRGEQALKGVGEPVRVWAVQTSNDLTSDV